MLVLVVIVEVGVVVVTVVVAAVVAAVDGAVLVDDVMAIASIFASTSPLPEMRLKIGAVVQVRLQVPAGACLRVHPEDVPVLVSVPSICPRGHPPLLIKIS